MLTTVLLGIGASIFTEIVTFLNKKFNRTVFNGNGAFILAALIALIFALVKQYVVPTVAWETFVSQFTMIWASSQVFFIAILQAFNLDVKSQSTGASING